MYGGITGALYNGIVRNCFNLGNITSSGNNYNKGGIVGEGGSNATIQNCYNMGSIAGYYQVGGIVGAIADNGHKTVLANCYNIGKVTGSRICRSNSRI